MFRKDGNNEIKSTAHSKYRCQYHIVFAPKYRRKEIYGTLKKDIGEILRKLCGKKAWKLYKPKLVQTMSYACKYPTVHKYSTIYGISQGQKQFDDF